MKIIDLKNLKLENNKYLAKYLDKEINLNDHCVVIVGEIDETLKEKISQSNSYIVVINDQPLEDKDNNLNYIFVKDENLVDFLETFISCLTDNAIIYINVEDLKEVINNYNIVINEKNKTVKDVINGLNFKLTPYENVENMIILINGNDQLTLFNIEDIVAYINDKCKASNIYFTAAKNLKEDGISTSIIIGLKENK